MRRRIIIFSSLHSSLYGLDMNASASQKMLENIVRSIETPKDQQEEIKLNLNKVNDDYDKP